MNSLPRRISPTSRAVAGTVDRLWVDLYGNRVSSTVDEPAHPKVTYLNKLAEIGGEFLIDPLRRLGDTYLGMPMASFLKACEKHDFILNAFPASINRGGHVPVLFRERDGGMIVGYAQEGSMRSAAFFLPHGNRESGFGTECHDCRDALGMLMDIHDHGGNGYPVKWDSSSRDRQHAMALLCPFEEFKLWSEADLSPEAATRYIEDVCRTRIGTLPTPWRELFSRILMPPPARLRRP